MEFIYLDQTIMKDAQCGVDIERRMAKAKRTFREKQTFKTTKNVKLKLQKCLRKLYSNEGEKKLTCSVLFILLLF